MEKAGSKENYKEKMIQGRKKKRNIWGVAGGGEPREFTRLRFAEDAEQRLKYGESIDPFQSVI